MRADLAALDVPVSTLSGGVDEMLARAVVLARTRIELEATLVGRAAREGRPIDVPDLTAGQRDAHLQELREARWCFYLLYSVCDSRVFCCGGDGSRFIRWILLSLRNNRR
jgi:hypothetical protein